MKIKTQFSMINNAFFSATLLCLVLLNPSAVTAQQQAAEVGQISKISPPASVLVFGDSLSAAYGIDKTQGWVALLALRLQQLNSEISVHNASLSGETTSGGLQRLPKTLAEIQPRLMILELGANDALRGQNLLQTKANLEQMIQACRQQANGCQVLLLGIRLPSNYGPAYERLLSKVYRGLAQKYELSFDPFFLEEVALEPNMMQADGLHPTAAAQNLIVERLWPLISAYF
ncbi:arylesterase [Thiosulfatimonas sediminis]|uniref:Arylesterase n=2 Tax=Thiosulfatimonas sediminis TaxID=2675054 RepID=A0A6F8PWA1_9GAMM|nr:arylesterase [Thiosulfatimonas sediminis]